MKKARYDVIKFAMTGLSGTDKHDAETALAISLGAKAPKSAYVNYKDLQATRKKEKEEREAMRRSHPKPKVEQTTSSKKGVQKKPQRHSLETTGIYKVKFPVDKNNNKRTMVKQSRSKRRK